MLVAALAGLTVLMGAHKGKPGMLAGMATAVAGAVVVVHGAWLHLKDAEIYHPNIRVAESAEREDSSDKKKKKRRPVEETDTRQVSTQPARPHERRARAARPY